MEDTLYTKGTYTRVVGTMVDAVQVESEGWVSAGPAPATSATMADPAPEDHPAAEDPTPEQAQTPDPSSDVAETPSTWTAPTPS